MFPRPCEVLDTLGFKPLSSQTCGPCGPLQEKLGPWFSGCRAGGACSSSPQPVRGQGRPTGLGSMGVGGWGPYSPQLTGFRTSELVQGWWNQRKRQTGCFFKKSRKGNLWDQLPWQLPRSKFVALQSQHLLQDTQADFLCGLSISSLDVLVCPADPHPHLSLPTTCFSGQWLSDYEQGL